MRKFVQKLKHIGLNIKGCIIDLYKNIKNNIDNGKSISYEFIGSLFLYILIPLGFGWFWDYFNISAGYVTLFILLYPFITLLLEICYLRTYKKITFHEIKKNKANSFHITRGLSIFILTSIVAFLFITAISDSSYDLLFNDINIFFVKPIIIFLCVIAVYNAYRQTWKAMKPDW